MSQQPRPAWARLPFMARASLNPPPPAPVAQPDPTPAPAPAPAPPPIQPLQPRAPFSQLPRTPALPSQLQEPTPPSPPPPAATPAPPPSPPPPPAPAAPPPSPPPAPAAPPALASSPPRSTVAPPVPIAQPAPTPVPPPIQPPQPRAPFRQLTRTVPFQLSQPREPTPPPPPAAPPASPPSPPPPPAAAPPELARSPPRSPIAPQVPAPSTPRRFPISAPPSTAAPSPKPPAPLPPQEKTTAAALKSPVINTLTNSPAPKEPLTTTTKPRVPSSPIRESPKTTTQPSSSWKPASPVPKPVATAAPESSPKIVKSLEKTPVQSPKPKLVASPPSPFTLPPSQIKSDSDRESKIPTKVDQKDVLVQETIEKLPKLMPTNSHSSSIASNGRQELPKENIPNKKISDSEKLGMSVITLTGENKGAVMELSPSRNKNRSITNPHSLHKNGNYPKLWSEGEKSSSDEEGRSNKEKNKKAMVMQSPPMTAYVNSNVQGLNNSIIFNGSSTHHNPGVHLSINRKANGSHGIHPKDHHA